MKYPLALLLLTAQLAFAQAKPPAHLNILGHAGSGFFTILSPFNFRPPSSWRGIEHALDLGADGTEVDVQLSRDSVVMLYHDVKLDNMTNGHGCVSEYQAAELTQLRYHGGFPFDLFQHERPITFDTLLARLSRRPGGFPHLHLDLHEDDACAPDGQHQAHVPTLVRCITRSLVRYHVPLRQVLLTTQNIPTIRLSRKYLPGLLVGLEITSADFATRLHQGEAEKVRAVVLDADAAQPTQIAAAHAAGLRVVLFGGRSGGNLRAIMAKGPDEMEVDNVRRLLHMQGRK